MVHVNSALLAGHALGQDDALDAAEQEHLASCSHCRAELDQYRRVVTLGQGAQASEMPTPPLDRIWRSIQAELAPNSTTEESRHENHGGRFRTSADRERQARERCARERCDGERQVGERGAGER